MNITDSNIQTFLRNNDEVSGDFYDYLNNNIWSTDSKNFILWASGYLAENQHVDFDALKSKITLANLDLNDPLLVDKLLRLDFETRIIYPKFAHLIDNMDKTVKANPKVLAALVQYSGMTESQILADLKPGQGPLIKLQQLNYPREAFGKFDPLTSETTLLISQDDVDYFEQRVPANYISSLKYDDQRSQALGFVLALTTLHEYVHYGRYTNNLKIVGNVEFGKQFEISSVGFDADYANMYDLKIKFILIW